MTVNLRQEREATEAELWELREQREKVRKDKAKYLRDREILAKVAGNISDLNTHFTELFLGWAKATEIVNRELSQAEHRLNEMDADIRALAATKAIFDSGQTTGGTQDRH